MQMAEGVFGVDGLGMGRAYLAVDADRVTLIDTGLPGRTERVLRAVAAAGQKAENIRQIVITHHHVDHTGGLAELVERTGAKVMVHALDAPVVRGERPPPGPTTGGPLRPLIGWASDRMAGAPTPVAVDRELADGDEIDALDGMRVVHVPGHTPGSIAFYCPKRRVLFSGDAVANTRGLGGPIGWYTEDMAQAKESIRKLAELDFDVVCFGHGSPLDKDASVRFRRFADRLR